MYDFDHSTTHCFYRFLFRNVGQENCETQFNEVDTFGFRWHRKKLIKLLNQNDRTVPTN